jgi:hypothetical protein
MVAQLLARAGGSGRPWNRVSSTFNGALLGQEAHATGAMELHDNSSRNLWNRMLLKTKE